MRRGAEESLPAHGRRASLRSGWQPGFSLFDRLGTSLHAVRVVTGFFIFFSRGADWSVLVGENPESLDAVCVTLHCSISFSRVCVCVCVCVRAVRGLLDELFRLAFGYVAAYLSRAL